MKQTNNMLKWLIIVLIIILGLAGFFFYKYYYLNAPEVPNMPSLVQTNKKDVPISITFNDNTSREQAEVALTKYGDKLNLSNCPSNSLNALKSIYDNNGKNNWCIKQGRLFEFILKIRPETTTQDLKLISNNNMVGFAEANFDFQNATVEEKKTAKTGVKNIIIVRSKADIDNVSLRSFLTANGFEIIRETINPVYAMFYPFVGQQDQLLKNLGNDPAVKKVYLNSPEIE